MNNLHHTGDVRPVTTPAASSDGAHPRIPAAEMHARRIAREAERWTAFTTERTKMHEHTVARKALDSCAFSVARRASSLAVPSKLAGTKVHQRRLWGLIRKHVQPYVELDLDLAQDAITALYDGDPLGSVQTKHLSWLRPLVPFGARLYLARITGSETTGYTLGVNVVVGHVGDALTRLRDALGTAGGDGSGDGATALPVLSGPAVPVLPEHAVLDGAPDDIALWTDHAGSCRASVPHVVQHSPTGIAWGYHGSGPADLALSVLTALAGRLVAERHYQAFKTEVVAHVPERGGTLRAADVRAWIAAQERARPSA
jgi:hypothetical protein